jgi:hypothetical protein
VASGLLGRGLDKLQEATGQTLVSTDRLALLEQAATDLRTTERELDLMGWHVLDYFSGQSQELRPETRRKWAQKARYAWMNDPMAGAAVDLMNDFTFGRGIPKPRAEDEDVQTVLDEFWDDPDNQLTMTSYAAQVALGTDLSLQSNLFLLMFDGDDGKIKLGLLNHDDVMDVVRDPDYRLRILYYVAKKREIEWDFENDAPKLDLTNTQKQMQTWYYEHWQNIDAAKEARRTVPKPPKKKLAEGRVYHIAINRTSEMAFGVPTMQRTLRWFGAYNDFMKSRVDMVKAAAAFIMQRKIKGTENQLTKMASRAITRRSDLAGAAYEGSDVQAPPATSGNIANVNEAASLEPLKLSSGAGEASSDAEMLRAQVSAATRFPQHYLGDAGSANLATATAMELPVLKAVEARQEVFENAIRWALDRVIEKAVDSGRLDPNVVPEEEPEGPPLELVAAHEEKAKDESKTERNLDYEFAMPPPLRRLMSDLVSSVSQIAQTFDPNNTNIELSRILLAVALGDGLEMQDPQAMVERVFPEDYVDPAVAAAQAAAGGGFPGGGGPPPPPGPPEQSAGEEMLGGSTVYGAKGGAVPAEGQPVVSEARLRARDGGEIIFRSERGGGGRYSDLPETDKTTTEARKADLDRMFEVEVTAVADEEMTKLTHGEHARTNGRGRE